MARAVYYVSNKGRAKRKEGEEEEEKKKNGYQTTSQFYIDYRVLGTFLLSLPLDVWER